MGMGGGGRGGEKWVGMLWVGMYCRFWKNGLDLGGGKGRKRWIENEKHKTPKKKRLVYLIGDVMR